MAPAAVVGWLLLAEWWKFGRANPATTARVISLFSVHTNGQSMLLQEPNSEQFGDSPSITVLFERNTMERMDPKGRDENAESDQTLKTMRQ